MKDDITGSLTFNTSQIESAIKFINQINAIIYCNECKKYFCNKCHNYHLMFNDHKVIDLNNLNDIFIDKC